MVATCMALLSKHNKHTAVLVKRERKTRQKAMDILLVESSQLNKKDIFDPQHVENLSHEEKVETPHLITMVKEKRDGVMKARACGNGRKHRR